MKLFRYDVESIARFTLSYLLRLTVVFIASAILIVLILIGVVFFSLTSGEIRWLQRSSICLERKIERCMNFVRKVKISNRERMWDALSQSEKDEERP